MSGETAPRVRPGRRAIVWYCAPSHRPNLRAGLSPMLVRDALLSQWVKGRSAALWGSSAQGWPPLAGSLVGSTFDVDNEQYSARDHLDRR